MVAHSQPQIEHYERHSGSGWLYSSVTGLEDIVEITSIGCTLKLADVYDRIVLTPEEEENSHAVQ